MVHALDYAQPEADERLVFVEPEIVPSKPRKTTGGPGNPGGRTPKASAPFLSLSDLSLSPLPAGGPGNTALGFAGSNSPLGMLRAAPHTLFFDRLHDRIESALYYPEEFKENAIEGVVEAELEWRREGNENRVNYRVLSASPFLRVFVIQRLRKIFGDEHIGRAMRENETIKMRCQFHFEMVRREGKALASHGRGVMGNQLTFYRIAKHRGQWRLGPLQGFAIAPSVGVDVDWFVRQFEEEKPDPLDRYRKDPEWRSG